MRIVSSFATGEYHGYNVKYSPFRTDVLACATSENYGIAGRGRLYILSLENLSSIKILSTTEFSDGLFDVTWSEVNPQLLVTSCGDGSIQLWDYVTSPEPVAFYKIHEKEVYSVDWSVKYPFILSASWDNSVRVWDPFAAKELNSYLDHTDQVYEAKWCPNFPDMFASVSGDGTLKLWDTKTSPSKASGSYPHGNEVLCCDWSKSDQNIIAVGTTDGKIIGWDLRRMKDPIFVLVGHQYAIRRLKFSPFERGSMASVSYDFTTRFWNWNMPYAIETHNKHTEFVYGLDFSPLKPYEICDCAWDSLLHIYTGSIS